MSVHLTVAGYLIEKNEVLLIHHRKLDLWLPVGGHIDQNETPDTALEKEFREEVGLEVEVLYKANISLDGNIKTHSPIPFYCNIHNVGNHDHYCMFFVCVLKGEGKIKIQKREVKNFAWFTMQKLSLPYIPADVRHIAFMAFEHKEKKEKEENK